MRGSSAHVARIRANDPRLKWLIWSGVLFLVFTLLAYFQPPPHLVYDSGTVSHSLLDRLLIQSQTNSFLLDPVIASEDGRQHFGSGGPFVLPGTTQWWVPANGAILHSPDGSRWSQQLLQPPNNSLLRANCVYFLDEKHGWVEASSQLSNGLAENPVCLATADGGLTWSICSYLPKGLEADNMFFLDSMTGLLVTADGSYRTPDGGRHWALIPNPKPSSNPLLVFKSGTSVLGFDDEGFWSSPDRGHSWKKGGDARAFVAGNAFPIDIACSDRTVCWAAAVSRNSREGPQGYLAKSTDGGLSWSYFLDMPNRMNSIAFIDTRQGWAVGNGGTVVVTADQGVHWTPIPGPPGDLLKVEPFGPNHAQVFSTSGLYETFDRGFTWVHLARSGLARQFAFRDDQYGAMISVSGWLYRTSDGGRSWTKDSRYHRLRDIVFLKNGPGYILGDSLWRTDDGGTSWVEVRKQTSTFSRVLALGPSSVALFGPPMSSSWVSASSDKGGTWPKLLSEGDEAQLSSEFNAVLRSVQPLTYQTIDSRRLLAIGIELQHFPSSLQSFFIPARNGFLFKVTPGTLKPDETIQTPTHEDLYDVLVNGSHGYAVGSSGTILVTDDAGKTWTQKLSGTSSDLWSIEATDANHAWILGDSCILRTTNGGQTWQAASYDKGFAPWYRLTWILCLALLAPTLRKTPARVGGVAMELVTDRPIETAASDALNFIGTVQGLSDFIRNSKTRPPMTFAVTGDWGTGKSSLMKLLKEDLSTFKFLPVWFNAWHHQNDDHFLAALLSSIREQGVPPLFHRNGLRYRLNLIGLRGPRLIVALSISVLLISLSAAYLVDHRDQLQELSWAVNNLNAALTAKHDGKPVNLVSAAGGGSALLLLGVSLTTLVGTLVKAAKGFGIQPGRLLKAGGQGTRVKDLDRLAGFRYQFAQEFKDVTQALDPLSMVIIIDDLDRCAPENIPAILESLNFLVSSGDCFVVLGMAKERVERSIALQFKDQSAFLEDCADTSSRETFNSSLKYARNYLEKLINIEVPVPAAPANAPERLFQSSGNPSLEDRLSHLNRIARAGAVALSLLALVFVGAKMATYLPEPPKTQPSNVSSQPAKSVVPPASSHQTAQKAQGQVAKNVEPKQESGTLYVRQAQSIPPPPQTLPNTSLLIPIALLVSLVVVWRLSVPQGAVTVDSNSYTYAVNSLCSVLEKSCATPRSYKRLMNRMRYFAMAVRPRQVRPAWWQRALPRRFQPAPPPQSEPEIPDPAIVYLSVADFLSPGSVEQAFASEPQEYVRRAAEQQGFDIPPVPHVQAISEEQWKRFQAIASGVSVRD